MASYNLYDIASDAMNDNVSIFQYDVFTQRISSCKRRSSIELSLVNFSKEELEPKHHNFCHLSYD